MDRLIFLTTMVLQSCRASAFGWKCPRLIRTFLFDRLTMFSDTEVELPQMSHTSLVLVTDGSELSCLGKEGVAQRCKEKEEPLGQACTPPLSLVMQRGTARHVVPEGFHEDPCVSIVVQAERKAITLRVLCILAFFKIILIQSFSDERLTKRRHAPEPVWHHIWFMIP